MRVEAQMVFCVLSALPSLADAEEGKGYATGWGHEVRVVSHVVVGLEAGIPRDSLYAKGLEFDRRGKYQQAYDAFKGAYNEFRALQKHRPNDGRIKGWLLKVQEQRGVSYALKRASFYRHRGSFNSYYRRHRHATNCHLKWLAIRAFGLAPPRGLLDQALASYRQVLKLRPSHALSRLQLAALYHEVGKGREGCAEFARAQAHLGTRFSSFWKPLAYYYTVSGQRDKAFEYLRKMGRSSWRRREVLQSNFFDRLRADPRFEAVAGAL